MSLPKFNGKVVLSATNLADVSAGAKTSWNATFAFSDSSGTYLGSQVAVGDILVLDTAGVDIGTTTVYSVTSVVSSTFNSFRVVMSYLTINANPGGAPDISTAVNVPGAVARRSTLKGLVAFPNASIQQLPDALAYQLLNNNMFDILDGMGTAIALSGGTAGAILYQSAVNITSFSTVGTAGSFLTSGGVGAPTWTSPSALTVGLTTNVAGGLAGEVHYQSATNVSGFTAVGTTGQLLASGGTGVPTWVSASNLTVSSATTATNITGGAAGQIHYQSAVSTTAFSATGTAGQILISGGVGAPTWLNQSALSVSTVSNLAGGTAGSMPYQTAAGATSFLAAGTLGYVLTSTGTTTAPSWQAVTATTQAYGDATTNIATTAFVDRLRSSPASSSTTAVLADRGKTIVIAAGVTIPASVFAAGDCFSIYNNSAASITLTSGSGLTLWLVGTATIGNRALAQRGIATVYYVSATEAVITGGGLT